MDVAMVWKCFGLSSDPVAILVPTKEESLWWLAIFSICESWRGADKISQSLVSNQIGGTSPLKASVSAVILKHCWQNWGFSVIFHSSLEFCFDFLSSRECGKSCCWILLRSLNSVGVVVGYIWHLFGNFGDNSIQPQLNQYLNPPPTPAASHQTLRKHGANGVWKQMLVPSFAKDF